MLNFGFRCRSLLKEYLEVYHHGGIPTYGKTLFNVMGEELCRLDDVHCKNENVLYSMGALNFHFGVGVRHKGGNRGAYEWTTAKLGTRVN